MFLLPMYLNLYCLLWESFCFTGVAFFSVIFLFSCGLITSVSITLLFFDSWIINEFKILSLFLSCSLTNDICYSSCFINLSNISFVEFTFTCSLGLCLTQGWKNSFFKLLTSVKTELFIFQNSPNNCSFMFPIPSIKTGSQFLVSFRQRQAFLISHNI